MNNIDIIYIYKILQLSKKINNDNKDKIIKKINNYFNLLKKINNNKILFNEMLKKIEELIIIIS